MLQLKDIVHLKITREALAAHQQMPPPRYVVRPLIRQFSAINDAVVSSLMGISTETFQAQLQTAREYGAAYLTHDIQRIPVGLSAATSLIRSGDVTSKNLIVPMDFLRQDKRLGDHYVIGTFIRGAIEDGALPSIDDVEVAGWATVQDIQRWSSSKLPATFQSKLPVVMMPCSTLKPISELMARIQAQPCCV